MELQPTNPGQPATKGKPAIACAISGEALRKSERVLLSALRPNLVERLRADHPGLGDDAVISRKLVDEYRSRLITELLAAEHGEVRQLDQEVAASIAAHDTIAADTDSEFDQKRSLGERLADVVASFGGSWTFIMFFFVVLVVWMGVNLTMGDPKAFDPYPFILLNLVLSCIAAIQAPIIMMSQKRQEAKDRMRSQSDYRVNLKAELEIRHLHEKMDHLLMRQWERLAEIQQLQVELLQEIRNDDAEMRQRIARKHRKALGKALSGQQVG